MNLFHNLYSYYTLNNTDFFINNIYPLYLNKFS